MDSERRNYECIENIIYHVVYLNEEIDYSE